MNSLQIEYFLCLAKNRNFTTTARELYVSQPTISKQIAALESEIGYSLFFRSNRDVSLTPAGIIFMKMFTDMTDQYKKGLEQINNIYSDSKNRFHLGCVEGMEISSLLNRIFVPFKEQFPSVEYDLQSHSPGELMDLLVNDKLDAVITTESFIRDDPQLSRSIFLNSKHILYISENNPLLSKENCTLSSIREGLKDEVFFILSPVASPAAKNCYFEWCQQNGIQANKVQYLPNVESEILSVEAGLGVTIADTIFRLNSNPLVRGIELSTSHNIYMVWKKSSRNLLIHSFAKLASQINDHAL